VVKVFKLGWMYEIKLKQEETETIQVQEVLKKLREIKLLNKSMED
jgi:hypothetical protein